MGNPVIDLALEALRTEGFTAVEAGPGIKAPDITGPVAAVSVHSADWQQQTVTLAVSVLCPAALGAVRCQSEALRAGENLTRSGARCSQGKCTYDGLARLYQVEVLAEFTGSFQGEVFIPEPGLSESEDKLTFKTFTWPNNPEKYREELVREPIHAKNGLYWTYYGMQPVKRVITGSGTFSGASAYERFKALAALFSDTEAGVLTHPVWGSRSVYFTALELTQSVRPEYVAYSFEFREADENGSLPH